MPNRYQIALFIGQDDSNPVTEYIAAQTNEKDVILIVNVIESLARVGQDLLDTDMAKPLGGPIFELRKDRHRITYAPDQDRFILLSAFLKRTKKTPPEERVLSLSRYEEYCQLRKCQVMKIAVDI